MFERYLRRPEAAAGLETADPEPALVEDAEVTGWGYKTSIHSTSPSITHHCSLSISMLIDDCVHHLHVTIRCLRHVYNRKHESVKEVTVRSNKVKGENHFRECSATFFGIDQCPNCGDHVIRGSSYMYGVLSQIRTITPRQKYITLGLGVTTLSLALLLASRTKRGRRMLGEIS